MFSDIKTFELNRETSPSNFQCDLNQCRYRGSRRYRYRYGYRYRRSKNQGHDVWLPTSSKRVNHSAQCLANFNAILFWTHLLIYIQQINNTQWRHLAIKSTIRFSLTKSSAAAFDCPSLYIKRGKVSVRTYVTYVRNAGSGQFSSEWRHNENDVIMRTGATSAVGARRHNENDVIIRTGAVKGDMWRRVASL